jgi:hypothetical protein
VVSMLFPYMVTMGLSAISYGFFMGKLITRVVCNIGGLYGYYVVSNLILYRLVGVLWCHCDFHIW